MTPPSLALGLYLEKIEELCRSLDRESLQQCILVLAKQVNPADRRVFLHNLRSVAPGGAHRELAAAMIEETFLMNEIATLRKEIENRMVALADASFWDKSDNDDRQGTGSDIDPKLLN